MELTRDERIYLRAQAHGLSPVVMIGNNGLTDPVLREIAASLDAHELIKVRVLGDDRDQRTAWLAEICASLGCAPVQQIGKLLVLYRPTQEGKPRIVLPKPGQKAVDPKALDAAKKSVAKKSTKAAPNMGRAGGGRPGGKLRK
ncbi:YhbY family RNA-binding protein [Chitinimonas sp. BJYL2]|uniref:YhbY family RNA-binding protein n=1 Tax=Chitinimonas sp. BJYL2 TaxID=2976696 RepID=UPI0022B3E67F|nr:YhbY family RNA-binding protein [Chitinimonas sp. BJYL2]